MRGVPASRYPAPGDEAETRRARAEAQAILDIYALRYPRHRLRLALRAGTDPTWGEPEVVEGMADLSPERLGPGFLGIVEGGSTAPDAPLLTVFAAIPRNPTPQEDAEAEAPWHPNGIVAKTAFRLSPLLYERLRYGLERRAEGGSARHRWTPLPRAGGEPLFAPAPPPQDRAPAILIAMHWLEVGGAEKLGFDCIEWARDMGLRVFVVASHRSLHRHAVKLPPGVTFIRLDRYLHHEDWPVFLENLIRAEGIGLIHIHHCGPAYGALSHLKAVMPWLRVIDSTHIVEYADGGYARIAGVWTNFVDCHHVISNQLAHLFRQRFHTGPKIRLGRMIDRPAGDLPPPNMRAGKTALEITFVGRLYYQKRPLTVVLMMRAIADWAKGAGVAVRFNFVGGGPFAGAADALMRRCGIRDLVTRHPAGSDVRAILRRSDVMLLPSSNEGLALVCYEAIEAGAIPITTHVGAQIEIVPDALLVPRDPRAAIAGAVAIVKRLHADQAFVDEQGALLRARHAALSADPTAEEVVREFYGEESRWP